MTGCSRPSRSAPKSPPHAEGADRHLIGVKPSRRLIVLLTLAAVALAALGGVGLYGLLAGPPERPSPTADPALPADEAPSGPHTDGSPLVPIAVTADAERFARSVALALFEWDTTRISSPVAIVEHLMEVAEPSGIETHGLYQDVQGYLPTAAQWRQLRDYDTRQRLDILALFVPESWSGIVADPANGIIEGVTAITIDATRTREGGWHGQDTVKEFEVSFTLFISCPAVEERCSLLRLSALDLALR